MAHERVPLVVIQRQHANLGITSVYLQGVESSEIISTVHGRPSPTISWFASELAIEIAPGNSPSLGGFWGLDPGGYDDGERQAARSPAEPGMEAASELAPNAHQPALPQPSALARKSRPLYQRLRYTASATAGLQVRR